METINSFTGGMNKDVSKSLYKEGSYIHAENFTLVTDRGLSTGSLRNVNGNEDFIKIPDCSNVVEITDILLNTSPNDFTLSITASTGTFTVNLTNVTSIENFGEQLKSQLAFTGVGVSYTDSKVVLYGLLDNNVLINNSIIVTLVAASNPAFPNVFTLNNAYINPVFSPKIIGWEVVRDQIVIFTAQSYLENPVNELGQIWKLTYDKYLTNPVITLVYNGYLNFSLAHPIPDPGATAGNYETPEIQKVYWTDNYNRPRLINIADANTMALTPEILEVVPNILKGVSTVYEVLDSGNIKTGIYQVSARLANTSGNTGMFITPSNPITIINEPEYIAVGKYEARNTGVTVAKSISARLYNIDTTYDRVEPVILYRENANAVPDVFVLPSQGIPNNGELTFKYTGGETVVPLSLDEFLESKIVFDTVKTMSVKNSILFFGNVKYSDFDVDFDTRAYRFSGKNAATTFGTSKFCDVCPGAQKAVLKDVNGITAYTFDGTNLPTTPDWGVSETADAIQDTLMQSPDSACNYLFQSDGITFGGEGPNVKYEFVRMYGVNDITDNSPFRTLLDDGTKNWANNMQAPYAVTGRSRKTVNYNLDGQTGYSESQQESNLYINSAGPFGSYTNKGYQRDEMYRFGIVFFSKKGQPSYVHWIADIRMPKPYMPDPNAANPDNRNALYFPISSVDTQFGVFAGVSNVYSGQINPTDNPSSGQVYGNNLGVKFTVSNLNTIADQISGYSIVRVLRKDADKSILGQGILNPAFYSGSGGAGALDDNSILWLTPNVENWGEQFNNQPSANGSGITGNEATFASPEFLFKSSPAYSSADQLDIIQVNNQYSYFTTYDGTRAAQQSTSYKLYNVWERGAAPRSADFDPTGNSTLDRATPTTIGQTQNIPVGFSGDIVTAGATLPTRNWGWTGDSAGRSISCSSCCRVGGINQISKGVGGSRLFIGTACPSCSTIGGLNAIGFGMGWGSFPGIAYGDGVIRGNGAPQGSKINVYLANYRRSNLVQYGGNSFSARSYNEYISTGHTQLVTANTHTDMVYGGDTYITLFDYAEQLRNSCVVNAGGTTQNRYDQTRNTIHIIPVECSFPIELRKNNDKPSTAVDDGYTDSNFTRCAPNKSLVYADLPRSLGGPATAPNLTAEWAENFDYEFDYIAENDVMKFFPSPYPSVYQNIFDVRIHRSQVKTNGEIADSWGVFKPEDYLDLDTGQGYLTNLLTAQNALMAFQEKGIAAVSVNERSLTQDTSGSEIILGTGGVLARYDYLSRIIGSRHQFSFTKSHDSVFWFDMNSKNVFKMTGTSPVAISVAKGMTSYFTNNLNGLIQISDNPYLDKGITATYDFRYNEAIMTFKDSVVNENVFTNALFLQSPSTGVYEFGLASVPLWASSYGSPVLVKVKNRAVQYLGTIIPGSAALTLTIKENPTLYAGDVINIYTYTPYAFTVGYNDFIDAFTSFYSFKPSVYINDFVSIFSPDSTLNRIFRHDVGEHSVFYYPENSGLPKQNYTYPSKLTLFVNQFPTETKVFDNYEIVCESTDNFGTHITNDLFSTIRLYNDYQNTDFQTLPVDGSKIIAKRKERTWNLSNLRNRVLYTTPGVDPDIFDPAELSSPNDKNFGERMRDKYLTVDLEYDNLSNYNFVLHTFKTHFRKSAR